MPDYAQAKLEEVFDPGEMLVCGFSSDPATGDSFLVHDEFVEKVVEFRIADQTPDGRPRIKFA